MIPYRRFAVLALAALPLSATAAPKASPETPLLAQAPAGALDWGHLNRFFDHSAAKPPLTLPGPAVRVMEKRPPPMSPLPFSGDLKSSRRGSELVIPVPKPDKPYRRLFGRLLKQSAVVDRYDDSILSEARRWGLDPRLLKSVMGAESEFNPRARSPKGAMGLMQVMPATAESVGVPRALLRDPWQNIKAGAAYIARLYSIIAKRYRLGGVRMADAPVWVVQRVIAAYHAGPKFLSRNSWYRSTRLYVKKVLLFYGSRVTDVRRQSSASLLPPEAAASIDL
ncbi:MAG: lytic transglycosylase domain-containing protein [Elusimicrobia bacterium]|nr:lytic transglycosylase domain-containing protein [Elusimicrobiota bacterium]